MFIELDSTSRRHHHKSSNVPMVIGKTSQRESSQRYRSASRIGLQPGQIAPIQGLGQSALHSVGYVSISVMYLEDRELLSWFSHVFHSVEHAIVHTVEDVVAPVVQVAKAVVSDVEDVAKAVVQILSPPLRLLPSRSLLQRHFLWHP